MLVVEDAGVGAAKYDSEAARAALEIDEVMNRLQVLFLLHQLERRKQGSKKSCTFRIQETVFRDADYSLYVSARLMMSSHCPWVEF